MGRYKNLGKRYVDWSKYDSLLGLVTDKAIALQAGCSSESVGSRRRKLGISSKFNTHWSKEKQVESDLLESQGMRRCSRCDEIKPRNCYDKSALISTKNARNGFLRWCKPCRAAYQSRRVLERRTQWIELAGGSCQNCGWDQWPVCLDFHHVDRDTKEWSPAKLMMSRPVDSPDVIDEIEKCVLLCSNCHQAIHRGAIILHFVKRNGTGWTVRK